MFSGARIIFCWKFPRARADALASLRQTHASTSFFFCKVVNTNEYLPYTGDTQIRYLPVRAGCGTVSFWTGCRRVVEPELSPHS